MPDDDLHFSRSGTSHFGKLTTEVKMRLSEIGAQGERPTARRLIDLRMRNAMACSDPKNAGSQ